ncbi:MAG TPA: hypothetical protein VMJ10_18400 [Kofleriaceae bacterium]|nr:hypothetical protein [Kofleriaceae bacterium]
MNARLALVIGAVMVLAMGVYLFVEVRATPEEAAPPIAGNSTGSGSSEKTADADGEAAGSGASQVAPPPRWSGEHGARNKVVGFRHFETRQTAAPDDGAKQVVPPAEGKPDVHADALMDQANKAYDRQDYDEAKSIAQKVLATTPNNVRMLRIMVSSSCIDGDTATAQKYYVMLPKYDRDQMKLRCGRDNGVTFTEPTGP